MNCWFLTNSVTGGKGGNENGAPQYEVLPGYGGDALGGGIYSLGPVALTNCEFSYNQATGGAGGSSDAFAIVPSNGGNTAGGAIYGTESILTTNCSFIGNALSSGVPGYSTYYGQPGHAFGGAICSQGGPLTIPDCTIIGNSASSPDNDIDYVGSGLTEGGGICNVTGLTTVVSSTIASNLLSGNTFGAGIYHGGGALLLSLSTIAANSAVSVTEGGPYYLGFPAAGGGFFNAATALVTQCSFVSNSIIGGNGGGVELPASGGTAQGAGLCNAGTLVVSACLVAGNMATGGEGNLFARADSSGGDADGGGLFNRGPQLVLINSTVANNTASGAPGITSGNGTASGGNGFGGGIYSATNGSVILTNCTLSGNAALGGICPGNPSLNGAGYGGNLAQVGVLKLIETIVNAGVSNNAYGSLTDLGYNTSSDASCALTGPGSLNNTDPKLQPLANNGGPTLTMALSVGSPAIDAGISLPGITTDQRGVARPYGPEPDIGAYEWNSASAPPVPFNLASVTLSNGTWSVSGVGPTNWTFRLQVSSNLVTWTSIATNNSGPSGAYSVQDNTAPAPPVRFYRVISP